MSDDYRVMLEIDGPAATVKFSEGTTIVQSGSCSMIEHFRVILCDLTGNGDWALTGIFLSGCVYTFERIDTHREWPVPDTAKVENQGGGDV